MLLSSASLLRICGQELVRRGDYQLVSPHTSSVLELPDLMTNDATVAAHMEEVILLHTSSALCSVYGPYVKVCPRSSRGAGTGLSPIC